MRNWGMRQWLIVLGATLGAAVVIGVPTGIIPTPVYTRMTPVQWWNYPIWSVTSLLEGLLLATYVRSGGTRQRATVASSGLLAVFSVGCPICNKLVVLAIGISGALTYFAPVQPLLGLVSVGLLQPIRDAWSYLQGRADHSGTRVTAINIRNATIYRRRRRMFRVGR